MALMLLVGGLIVVVVIIVAALIALRLQRRASQRTAIQQEAWEKAQEIRDQQWRLQQDQKAKEVALVQRSRDQEQKQALASTEAELQQQRKLFHRALVERELARLRRIEDTPLPVKPDDPNYQPGPDWEPLQLPGADLAGRDFSSRYLRHADLRGANLAHANFFMADLSWACLADADLTGADLSAANLQYADLQGAQLSEARFLVSDLQYSHLAGANLRGAYNLSNEQLALCHVDQHTQLDEHIHLPVAPLSQRTPLPLLPAQKQILEPATDDKEANADKADEDIHHNQHREVATRDRETPLPEPIEREEAENRTF
jgi:Pentapeptide repeats (8 copies)